jgi:hypothetical protein
MLDETKAGSDATCHPTPRRHPHEGIQAGSCAARSPAPRRRHRTTRQRPGPELRALP